MKLIYICLLIILTTCIGCASTHTQKDIQTRDTAISYDFLVDGDLPADNPQYKQFKTLQAAYQAAAAGTAEKPTVIAIKPNVYQLTGGKTEPGLTINKDYISLVGLTDNRAKVVLADNRGLQQGAQNNGFVLDVNATGFTAKNLTIINYCNIDYNYPGDPAKNLNKRSDVITQAVALQARGDKHVYQNVQILSRLDTMFLMAKRAFFDQVYIEGTDDWVGGGDIAYWQNSTLALPTGKGVMLAMNNVFYNTKFIAENALQFYKVGFNSHLRPSVLINSQLELGANGQAHWMREQAPVRPYQYSLTWQLTNKRDQVIQINDSAYSGNQKIHSRALTKAELQAFNPWNLLRAVPGEMPDNWDPANARQTYKTAGDAVFRIKLSSAQPNFQNSRQPEFHIRTGQTGVRLSASVIPVYASDKTVSWHAESDLIKITPLDNNQVEVIANNQGETAKWAALHATAKNGHTVTAWFYVEPARLNPPELIKPPQIVMSGAQLSVNYQLKLAGRADESKIIWYLCKTQSCDNATAVNQNQSQTPANTIRPLPGFNGAYIKAELYPKHTRSDYGDPISIISQTQFKTETRQLNQVSANFSQLSLNTNKTNTLGLFSFSDNWEIIPVPETPAQLGLHSTNPANFIYHHPNPVKDMQVKLAFRTDKSAGQVFSVPGSPEDDGDNNLHADFYIKYDAVTRSGYSLRFWRTTQAADAIMFQFYKIENGKGSPLSEQQILSGVFKRNTQLTLSFKNEVLSVNAHNSKDEQKLSMSTPAKANPYGGAGISWSRGSSAIFTEYIIRYLR